MTGWDKWCYAIIWGCRKMIIVFSWLLVSSSFESQFSLPHQKFPSIPPESKHYIPCICIGTTTQWFFLLFLSLLELLLDLFCTLRTPTSSRFCFPQRFLARFPHSPVVMGTTKSLYLYFFASINEGRGLNNREDNEEDITVRIRKWSQSIVLFLSSSIPQSQCDHTSIDFNSGRIIIKDSRDILSRKPILSITR